MEKYCLVTGATGGLGTEFCKKLLLEGKNLIISGTKLEKLESLKANLLKEIYGNEQKIVCFECDLSCEDARQKFFAFLISHNFEIEMLVNNAGYITEEAVLVASKNSLEKAIKVNCEGTILLSKFVLDKHKQDAPLTILTVASFAGFYPMPYMAIYAATKSFLISFFRALRQEVKDKNIKVCVVAPSGIYTTQEMKEAIKSQGLGGKLSSMPPEKIAEIALKGAKKGKGMIVPGFFNKLTKILCKFLPTRLVVKTIGKRWKKSQQKRGFKFD